MSRQLTSAQRAERAERAADMRRETNASDVEIAAELRCTVGEARRLLQRAKDDAERGVSLWATEGRAA